MKKQGKEFSSLPKLAASLCTFQLCCGGAHAADADKAFHSFTATRVERQAWRASRGQRSMTPGFLVPPGQSADPSRLIHSQRFNDREPNMTPGFPVPTGGPGRKFHLPDQHRNHNILPNQISVFQTNRPSNRSTYVNDNGNTRALHKGVSLDLSSTNVTIAVGKNLLGDSSVTINVNGNEKQISAGSQVTAAEYAALNQKLATGHQGLKLNDAGAAIAGSLNINLVSDDGRTIRTSELVIPESVAVSGDFARHADGVRVTNDLVNFGSLYATSSDRRQNNATIAARDINNQAGGLISTDGGRLNLALRADRDLNNSGDIYSSGGLELSAGSSLTNSGSATARGDLSLKSANVRNSGSMTSRNGNISITAPTNANLTVDAAGGTFQASNGDINLSTTPGDIVNTNTTLTGGNWYSNNLNIVSGAGDVKGTINSASGMVNISGCSANFNSLSTDTLTIGVMNLSGDPLISGGGDVVIGADQITGGAPLSVVAGGNITLGGATKLDTSNPGRAAGTMLLVAGAAFTTNANDITITGGTAGGGSVDLTGLTLFQSGSNSTAAGADTQIIAFKGATAGTGTVTTPAGVGLFTGGTSKAGNLTIIAGATTGSAISVGNLDTSLGGGKGGNITVTAATPTVVAPVVINSVAGPAQGRIISGSFGTGALTGGSITTTNITTDGGNVSVAGGGDVSIGAIQTSGSANASGGNVVVTSGATSTLTAGGITTNGANGGGNAGDVTVTAGTGGTTTLGSINARASQFAAGVGNGGSVDVTVFQNTTFFTAPTINANGGGLSGDGGSIDFKNIGNGGITFSAASAFTVNTGTGGGNGGSIIIDGAAGAVDGQVRFNTPVNLNANASNFGFNSGSITVIGSTISFEGATGTHKLSALNGKDGTGNITLQTTAAGAGIFSTAGNSVDFKTTGTVKIDSVSKSFNTSSNTSSSGNISIEGDGGIDATGVNFSSASSFATGAGGALTFTSLDGKIITGNLTTNGATTGAGGAVTINSGDDLTVGDISTVGGTSGGGGNVSLTAEATTSLNVGSVTTNGNGAKNAGDITIGNPDHGVINLNGNLTANSVTGKGGAIFVVASDKYKGILEFNSAATISASGGGTNGVISLTGSSVDTNGKNLTINNNGAGGAANVIIDTLLGGIVTTGGNLNITAKGDLVLTLNDNSVVTKGAAADAKGGDITLISTLGNIDASAVNLDSRGNATNGDAGNIVLTSGAAGFVKINDVNAAGLGTGKAANVSISSGTGGALVAGTISGDALLLNLNKGPVTVTTAVNSLTTSAFTQTITVNEVDDIRLDTQVIDTLNVNAGGDITTGAASSNFNALNLQSGPGKSIIISSNLAAATDGKISLTTSNGSISQTASGALTTSGTGGLFIDMSGATPGNVTLDVADNSINRLTTSGLNTSTINLTNASAAITLEGVGSNQSLNLTTTSLTGVVVDFADLTSTGTLTINAPRYASNRTVNFGSVLIQNLVGTGNLAIDGLGGGGTVTGTTPAAGPPGTPSVPAAIIISTKDNANLQLSGLMTFNGDVAINNKGGTTTSLNGSLFTGNNNITLNTGSWVQNGTPPQITAKNLIINLGAGGTIVNTAGTVDFGTNTTLNGSDFAIIAATDINITGATIIDLSNSAGKAGNLTLLAGFTYTPASSGQEQTTKAFTVTGNSAGGNINAGNLTANLSATGAGNTGGNLIAVAQNGTVTLGSVDASSSGGNGGSVLVIGEKAITTGSITTTGSTADGDIGLFVAKPTIAGTPVITDGTSSGGVLGVGATTTGNINASTVNAGKGNITMSTSGAASKITLGGAVTASSLTLAAGDGVVASTFSNTLTVQETASGHGGFFSIDASSITTPTTFNAIGTNDGGTFIWTRNSTNALTLGTGNIVINVTGGQGGGLVAVNTGGDLTVNAGGISAAGTAGNGAQISLDAGTGVLNLASTAFLIAANATGVNGNGGLIGLGGKTITYTSTSTAPLALSANGVGTGNGGLITYATDDVTPVNIGVPANVSKKPNNFLTLSATAGATQGAGGGIFVTVGGDLFADTSKMLAASKGADVNGANYALRAGNVANGELIVVGNLDASATGKGSAGKIDLQSNSKTAFDIGASKTPKNGVFGNLIASSGAFPVGQISVLNKGGDVSVETTAAVQAPLVTLTALNNGDITEGKGAVITATALFLVSDTGTIGRGSGLNVAANVLSAKTADQVNLNNSSKVSSLTDSKASKKFTLDANGLLDVGDLTVDGDITINGGQGGDLSVLNGKTITANNGEINLVNPDTTNGSILIGVGSTVQTLGTKGQDVTIAIGKAGKGVNTTPPAGVTPNIAGKGAIFFDPAGGVIKIGAGPNAVVNALGKTVQFFNGSTNTGVNKITLSDSSVVTADPPVKGMLGGSSTAVGVLSVPTVPFRMVTNNAVSNSFPTTTADQTVAPTTLAPQSTQPELNVSLNTGNTTIVSSNPSIAAAALGTFAALDGAAFLPASQNLQGLVTVTEKEMNRASGITGPLMVALATEETYQVQKDDLIVEAAFQSEFDAGLSEFATDKVAVNMSGNANKHYALREGSIVFAPQADTTIDTTFGTVKLAANSVALVVQWQDGLAVYNLYDHRKNAVVVQLNDRQVSLAPGRHVSISSKATGLFENVNAIELVQHRGLNRAQLNNGWNVFTSEFSIPSACYAVKPLRNLMTSKHKEAVKIKERMIKTAAVIMTLNPDRGDFVHFFKAQTTAMR